jgi:hypothetical protein
MNKELVKNLSLTIGGVILGGSLGYLIAEKTLTKKYRQIADEEIESVKASYQELVHKPAYFDNPEEDPTSDEAMEYLQTQMVPAYSAPIEDAGISGTIRDARRAGEPKTPYNLMHPKSKNAPTVITVPSDMELMDESQRDHNHPYIISVDEFMEPDPDYENYDQNQLTYYEGDETLVDERNVVIPDIERIVGTQHLGMFGRFSKEADVVYVRNEVIEITFEITRSKSTYSEDILGITPDAQE